MRPSSDDTALMSAWTRPAPAWLKSATATLFPGLLSWLLSPFLRLALPLGSLSGSSSGSLLGSLGAPAFLKLKPPARTCSVAHTTASKMRSASSCVCASEKKQVLRSHTKMPFSCMRRKKRFISNEWRGMSAATPDSKRYSDAKCSMLMGTFIFWKYTFKRSTKALVMPVMRCCSAGPSSLMRSSTALAAVMVSGCLQKVPAKKVVSAPGAEASPNCQKPPSMASIKRV